MSSGAALGIALLGGLLTAGYQTAIAPRLHRIPEGLADIARAGEAGSHAGAYAEQIVTAAHEAFVVGWQQAIWVGVAALAAVLILTILRGPEGTRAAGTTADDPGANS